MEKSPSVEGRVLRKHLKSVEVMPEKFNVPVILDKMSNTSLELLNRQVMREYEQNLHSKRIRKE